MHPVAAGSIRRATAAVAAVVVSFAPLAACGGSGAEPAAAAAQPTATAPSAGGTPSWEPGLVGAPPPARVLLPRLGIDAALLPLHLGKRDELVPPPYGQAGWYEAGPEPGEPGRAVIAGHVDSKTGPDVFAALGEARAGDSIRVRLADRSTVTFLVQAVEVHPRADFPTSRVYGTDGTTELRLITCTGSYDATAGGYQDNVVVFARLADDR